MFIFALIVKYLISFMYLEQTKDYHKNLCCIYPSPSQLKGEVNLQVLNQRVVKVQFII